MALPQISDISSITFPGADRIQEIARKEGALSAMQSFAKIISRSSDDAQRKLRGFRQNYEDGLRLERDADYLRSYTESVVTILRRQADLLDVQAADAQRGSDLLLESGALRSSQRKLVQRLSMSVSSNWRTTTASLRQTADAIESAYAASITPPDPWPPE